MCIAINNTETPHNYLSLKNSVRIKPIHPFAARMAPEIAFNALLGLKKGSTILDPMSGSGTVLKTILEKGFKGLGCDIDPLAVLMTKAWTSNIEPQQFLAGSKKIIQEARDLTSADIYLPWIDNDFTTKEFIRFWFGREQIKSLRKLSFLLSKKKGPYGSLYKIALSKLIITKSKGASLAADISHSRPHKVLENNDFDVLVNYEKVCEKLAKLYGTPNGSNGIKVYRGDARKLTNIEDCSVDAIITSPPYLNALDYMRGHKMSLVWLGYSINELSDIRAINVGAEKAPDKTYSMDLAYETTKGLACIKHLEARKTNMIYRYGVDMHRILSSCARVLDKKGRATFVIGNSCINGVYVENSKIVNRVAGMNGLCLKERTWRKIPENKRYLPPPNGNEQSNLKNRMRTEVIMTFTK